MRGRSGACMAGACMAGEHAWRGAWHGVCVHGRGHAWGGGTTSRRVKSSNEYLMSLVYRLSTPIINISVSFMVPLKEHVINYFK